MKILICLNTSWNLFNFRAGLIKAFVRDGHEVIAVAPIDRYSERLADLGCRFIPLQMENGVIRPSQDILLLWRFWRLLLKERPDVFLAYTIKPNVYGSLVSQILGIPVINNIAGLGTPFIGGGWVLWIVQLLYKFSLRRSFKVFFQNNDDQQLFINHGLVKKEVSDLLPGSGIDLLHFEPDPMPFSVNKFRFLLIARMLRDKGISEYVEAAAKIRAQYPQVEFCLLGALDVSNPTAISHLEMDAWVGSGDVNYLGEVDDVRIEIRASNCIVLPSYREGVPRSLLEAAALCRPIIATNVAGCRDVVDDYVNGYLCNVRDADDLAEKMKMMLSLTVGELNVMGLRGRAKIEAEFDEKIVIGKYLAAINEVFSTRQM